jgi:hypothetical protein
VPTLQGGGGGRFTPAFCRAIPKPLATMNAFFTRKFPRLCKVASFKSYAEFLHRARYHLLVLCFTIMAGGLYTRYESRLTHSLKAAWFQPLNLICDCWLTTFA